MKLIALPKPAMHHSFSAAMVIVFLKSGFAMRRMIVATTAMNWNLAWPGIEHVEETSSNAAMGDAFHQAGGVMEKLTVLRMRMSHQHVQKYFMTNVNLPTSGRGMYFFS